MSNADQSGSSGTALHGVSVRAPEPLNLCVLVLFMVAGSGLRLLWPEDMEWKSDEIWMYQTAQAIAQGLQSWPALGMTSSTGIQNPAMSVWIFAVIAKAAKTPIEMVRWVQNLNICALWIGFIWTLRQKDLSHERLVWLQAFALMAVSPLAIVFSRKLWAQDLLPLASILLLMCHWHRFNKAGSLGWGFFGALIGQIHMSGFFFSAGLMMWTVLDAQKQQRLKTIPWAPWLAGTTIGLLPLLPWIAYMTSQDHVSSRTWVALLVPKYFLHWATTSLGINLNYSLGSHFIEFLKQPLIGQWPTFLVGSCHLLLLGVGIQAIGGWLMTGRKDWLPTFGSGSTPTSFYLSSAGIGTGALMAIAGLPQPIHYLIIAFPWPYLWLTSLLKDRHKLWLFVAMAQLAVAMMFLVFIHQTGGFADCDYGISYRLSQVDKGLSH